MWITIWDRRSRSATAVSICVNRRLVVLVTLLNLSSTDDRQSKFACRRPKNSLNSAFEAISTDQDTLIRRGQPIALTDPCLSDEISLLSPFLEGLKHVQHMLAC